jgi:hypothetical protein
VVKAENVLSLKPEQGASEEETILNQLPTSFQRFYILLQESGISIKKESKDEK